MSYEHRDSLEAADPHSLLFGHDDEEPRDEPPEPSGRQSRHQRRHRRRQRRRRRFLVLLVFVAVVIVAVSGWVVVRPIIDHRLAPKDYTGSGSGSVQVRVNNGDDAAQIGSSLQKAGVVRTAGAFTKAAKDNPDSLSIQPGVYAMHKQMSGLAALTLMLAPGTRIELRLSVPEGSTDLQIAAKLAQTLSVPVAQVTDAMKAVGDLGLPSGYTANSAPPTSAEGFLFPDTYTFDPGTSPSDALQQMVAEFTSKDRALGFANDAQKMHLTPYQALTVASMIEGEAKFPEDRAKVARVIYNRMKIHMSLGIDATSIYGAELAGQDPAKIDFDAPAPYNTRHTSNLPPTPIGNPGSAALTAAVNPTPGSWLYYVNGDADGHLYFTNSDTDFEKAVHRCQVNHWGCT